MLYPHGCMTFSPSLSIHRSSRLITTDRLLSLSSKGVEEYRNANEIWLSPRKMFSHRARSFWNGWRSKEDEANFGCFCFIPPPLFKARVAKRIVFKRLSCFLLLLLDPHDFNVTIISRNYSLGKEDGMARKKRGRCASCGFIGLVLFGWRGRRHNVCVTQAAWVCFWEQKDVKQRDRAGQGLLFTCWLLLV